MLMLLLLFIFLCKTIIISEHPLLFYIDLDLFNTVIYIYIICVYNCVCVIILILPISYIHQRNALQYYFFLYSITIYTFPET